MREQVAGIAPYYLSWIVSGSLRRPSPLARQLRSDQQAPPTPSVRAPENDPKAELAAANNQQRPSADVLAPLQLSSLLALNPAAARSCRRNEIPARRGQPVKDRFPEARRLTREIG
jgi:hypothetical protein